MNELHLLSFPDFRFQRIRGYKEIYKQTKLSGVYCFENITTKKVYVGQSNNILTRINNHISQIAQLQHSNKKFQTDFRTNYDLYEIKILELIDNPYNVYKEKMLVREAFFSNCYYSMQFEVFNNDRRLHELRIDDFEEFKTKKETIVK